MAVNLQRGECYCSRVGICVFPSGRCKLVTKRNNPIVTGKQ